MVAASSSRRGHQLNEQLYSETKNHPHPSATQHHGGMIAAWDDTPPTRQQRAMDERAQDIALMVRLAAVNNLACRRFA